MSNLVVHELVASYGDHLAVSGLSFSAGAGELVALLGPNGAGKSTTISCMTSLKTPDDGDITVGGLTIGRDDQQIRQRIGVVFQESLLDPLLTPAEILKLQCTLHDVPLTAVNDVLKLVDVVDFRDQRYGTLSGGQRRRVDIASALVHGPDIIFLDEPTAGLDPQSREQIWKIIDDLRYEQRMTVLLTTHYMHETEQADYVLIMVDGAKAVEGSPVDLRRTYGVSKLSLVPKAEHASTIMDLLDDESERLSSWEERGGAIHVAATSNEAALAMFRELQDMCEDFEYRHGSMDDVYASVVAGASQ